ncbi:hypothetical protein ACWDV4_03125 [Micromonospora sp. NPDC003197]
MTGRPGEQYPLGEQGEDTIPLIEPTTGAPFTALPQRAPLRVPPARSVPGRAGSGPSVRAAVPQQVSADEPAFWLPIEEVHWDGTPVAADRPADRDRSRRFPALGRRTGQPAKPPRHPMAGLSGLLTLTLLTSFFAWVSAEPLWLAVGHGERGTATVLSCTGNGIGLRCRGTFVADDGIAAGRDLTSTAPGQPVLTGPGTGAPGDPDPVISDHSDGEPDDESAAPADLVTDVRLAGVDGSQRTPGSTLVARMVNPDAGTAYVEGDAVTRHLRWLLGLALVVLCSVGIGWSTGALRLPDPRSRRIAVLAGLTGQFLILVGFLVAAF